MPKYKIGESIYTVADDAVENFLSVAEQNNDTPELVEETIQVDPGKKVTPKQQDAGAESVKTASNTGSASENGSLDLEKKIERPFADIDGVPYTLSQLEDGAKKYNLPLNDYLRSFELQGEQTGKQVIEYYPEVIALEEVVV